MIVEHYRAKSRHKIGGQAKAMVVTASRRARGPLQAGARQVHQRQGLRRRRRPRRVLRQARRSTASDVTESSMNGFPDTQTADRVRHRRVARAGRGREVPDRLRPADALRHVRRQAAHRAGRRADPVPAQPHLRPRRHPQGRHVRPRLPQRGRGHPRRRSSPGTARPSPRRPTRTCSTTPATTSTRSACSGPTRSSGRSPCCWPRARSPTTGSTPRWRRPSTGSHDLDDRRAGPVPRRPQPVHPHLRLPVAGGHLHRHQARARLPVLQGPRRLPPALAAARPSTPRSS